MERKSRKLSSSDKASIIQAMSEIRSEGEDDEKRRKERKEYQLYVTRMAVLAGLNNFSFQEFDYQPELRKKEFLDPVVPSYGHIITEARNRAKAGYFARISMVSALVVAGIFFDALLMGALAGILSVVFIIGAIAAIFQQLEERRRAVDRAVESAKVMAARMLAEFLQKVENDRQTFERDEEQRIDTVKRILAGVSYAVAEVCRAAAASVKLPFKLSGELELVGTEVVINFELPDQEFIPTEEWQEERNGSFSVSNRSVTNINRLYAEAIVSAMLQVGLRILEKAASLEAICLNGYFNEEGRTACLAGLRMTREDIEFINRSGNALAIIEKLGNMRGQTNSSLARVEPMLPGWVELVSKQEILIGKVYCGQISFNT